MLHAATDLMRYKAVVDGGGLPITDLFFSPDLSTLTYLALRKSAAPWAEHGVVSTRHLGLPDTGQREVHVGASEAVVAEAPVVEPAGAVDTLAQSIASNGDATPSSEIEAVYERASDWLGAPVTHQGEIIGRVDDFLIEWPRPRVTHLVVNTGIDVPERQVVLPEGCYEVPCDTDRSIRVRVDRETLEKAPEIEALDKLDRHWFDTVRAYYKLPV